jgi:uncharacterized protein (DUF1015 family)
MRAMVNGDAGTSIPRPDGLLLEPFRGLRYDPDRVDLAQVLAPPYDVIDAAEQAALEQRDEHNVVRLTLPRDDAGPGSGYPAAARRLADWRAEGVLVADAQRALYVYEETLPDGHVQRGLVGAIGLTPAGDGIVLPHENTMAGPVRDRLALMATTEADLEPIFLVYDGGGAATEAVAQAASRPPAAEVSTDDGVRHRLWLVTDPETLAATAADLHDRRAVIADGHHRYATFLAYQQEQHAAGRGSGPWDFGLALLVDGSSFGPQVHPIHRVVPGLALSEAVVRSRAGFAVDEVVGNVADAVAALAKAGGDGPAFVLTDGETAWLLHTPDRARLAGAMPADHSPAWQALDVSVAHHYLIRNLWGLADREDVVDFRHDVEAAVGAARETGGVALLLNPTPVSGVAAVAAAGDRMPRKSTLFLPKPATGLVIRAFADA